jgi:tetratricopeptide (TPR) repeat protein
MINFVESREVRRIPAGALAGLLLLFWFSTLLVPLARSQNAPARRASETSQAALLESGRPAASALAGGETKTYEIRAEDGQFLHATVEQLGIHVSLKLYGPERKPIASMENLNGMAGWQQISAIAKSKGIYTLELASTDKTAMPGRYRVLLDELRVPTVSDRARISAEQALMNAGDIYRQAAAKSSTRAAQEYERSLSLWRSAGDQYEESVTLNVLGTLYLDFGDRPKALDSFNQALPLTRAVGDRSGESAARENIGVVYYANGEKQKALEQFTATLAFERETEQPSLQAETLSYLGEVSIDLGQEDAALADFEEALNLVRQSGNQSAIASVLTNIGKVNDDLGEKQKALDFYAQALSIDRARNDAAGESVTLSNIGMVYDALGERNAALDNYAQALKIERRLHASEEEATTLNNMASVYDELGQ